MPFELSLQSPAKINLHLRVGAVRQDGFHPLRSWMVTVGLFDSLKFLYHSDRSARLAGAVFLHCDHPGLPTDDQNLIVRAGRLFESIPSLPKPPIRVEVQKNIPMGGGLGGGSSNAASALQAFNQLWLIQPQRLNVDALMPLAAKLGSDVPFFLHAPSAICAGRGEEVTPIAPPRCEWAILMLPAIHMSTAAVYGRFDALPAEESASNGAQNPPAIAADDVFPESPEEIASWTSLKAVDLLPRLVNDLERPAFDLQPDLAKLREAAEEIVARPVRMSGSGSTLFTLFDTKDGAEQAGQEIQSRLSIKTIAVRIAP